MSYNIFTHTKTNKSHITLESNILQSNLIKKIRNHYFRIRLKKFIFMNPDSFIFSILKLAGQGSFFPNFI